MRRFELVEGSASKFWEVEVRGAEVVVRFGRIGSDGQTKAKPFDDAAAAAHEADKLVREKLGKGYAEVGGAPPGKAGGKAPKAAPAGKAPKKEVAAMPVPGRGAGDDREPGQLAFTRTLDELFARGWPNLRVLDDEVVPAGAARRQALGALQALDPYLPTILPREVARLVLLGTPFHPFEEVDAIKAAFASDGAVDEALLRRVLEVKYGVMSKRDETYDFRIRDTLLWFEAFLGTDVVAAAAIDHLVRGARDLALWGKDAFFIDHDNANLRRLVPQVGWLRLRLPAERWRALVKPLRKCDERLPRFAATLRALADDQAPVEDTYDALAIALQRRDLMLARELVAGSLPFDDTAQAVYVVGPELLFAATPKLKTYPKWWQERAIAELGTIRAAGTAHVMAMLLPSRSVGTLAASWLASERAWVEAEALPALAARPGGAAVVAAIREALGGAAPVAPTKAQLKKDLARVFAELPAQMKACKDDEAAERIAMRAAIDRYTEIRAAQGEVIPEAYFTHQLDLEWGADEARITRWIDIAVDVA